MLRSRLVLLLLLLVPALPAAARSQALSPALNDGPYLFHREGGAVDAVWIEDGAAKSRRFAKGEAIALPRFASLLGPSLALVEHRAKPAIIDAPARMLVISDVEGEYDGLVKFLRKNKVIDDRGKWSFGNGHLVTVGDMVDRGDQVTEVLWLMYRLSFEATAAGGRVHFILGNHEAMIMGGDIRYIADKYRLSSSLLRTPYPALYGKDTELGRWLRAQNSIAIVGDYVFVHAGIAPSLEVNRSTVEELNATSRRYLGMPSNELAAIDMKAAMLLWGSRGPFWYRGYFEKYAAASPGSFGPRTTEAQIDKILENLEAKSIVIGHTKVDTPQLLYSGRQVIAIDVPWTKLKRVRGLWVEGDSVELVDIQGKHVPFALAPTSRPKSPVGGR